MDDDAVRVLKSDNARLTQRLTEAVQLLRVWVDPRSGNGDWVVARQWLAANFPEPAPTDPSMMRHGHPGMHAENYGSQTAPATEPERKS